MFGAWIAWHFADRGQTVILLDAYGPAHSRASSGGESRIIRMGYGRDEIYTRWSKRSLTQWKGLFAATKQPLFHETGVLWLAGEDQHRVLETKATLRRCGIRFEELDQKDVQKRFPQIYSEDVTMAMLEPESGVLLARRAVNAVVEDAMRRGAEYKLAQVLTPESERQLSSLKTSFGESVSAGKYVFACGPWLGKMFPEELGGRIFPSRQEVFFFGVPAGDAQYAAPALPTFLFQEDEMYGMPDIESRGLKIAFDRHGNKVDPDTQPRIVSESSTAEMRKYVARRFPGLKDAPITETRVCQYENTSSGDFLIDRHPEIRNVWFAGGGSGHGFKHGPAVGEYVVGHVLDGKPVEPRFQLLAKETVQHRAIY